MRMRYLIALIPILFLPLPASTDPLWEYPRGYSTMPMPPRDRMEEWRDREKMERRLRREYCETHPWERECRR
jgi:hypothetical protein